MRKRLLPAGLCLLTACTMPSALLGSEDAVSVKLGERLYNRTCVWCHGEEGKGDGEVSKKEVLGIKPKAFNHTILNEEQIYLFAKHGGQYWGSPNSDMPGWGIHYSDTELKSIARYIVTHIKETPSDQ